jgi:alpha-methylacyl-CoA racemase
MIMADLGADVIRVDRPIGGELDTPAEFDLLNRGKRSIIVDLKRDAGVETVRRLAEQADMVVEGFRPGVVERLGLGPDVLLSDNPRLVYGRMTGWGQDGPLAHGAGHDITYLAVSGALHAIGQAGGAPQIPLNLIGDFAGGSAYLVIGLLAALHEAKANGHGQVIDATILDGTMHLLTMVYGLLAAQQWSDYRGVNTIDGGAPFYSVYETSDGRYMAVGALESKFYRQFLSVLDVDESPEQQHDRDRWPQLRTRFAERFASRTQQEWTQRFAGTDACVSPVLDLHEAARSPQVVARQTMVTVAGVSQPAPAPRLSRHPRLRPGRPPVPGAHTKEILSELGLAVESLLADRVVAEAQR